MLKKVGTTELRWTKHTTQKLARFLEISTKWQTCV